MCAWAAPPGEDSCACASRRSWAGALEPLGRPHSDFPRRPWRRAQGWGLRSPPPCPRLRRRLPPNKRGRAAQAFQRLSPAAPQSLKKAPYIHIPKSVA